MKLLKEHSFVRNGASGSRLLTGNHLHYTELEKKLCDFHEVEQLGLQERFIKSNSAIHCCIVPGNDKVKSISHKIRDKGFDVGPILSPTVPTAKERLRFCIHSYNSTKEIKEVLRRLDSYI